MAYRAMLQSAAESAIQSIGLGYDIAHDIRLKYCKQRSAPDPLLIELDHDEVQDIVLPGGLTVAGVSKSIKCDKGERTRFRSDVLSFQQVRIICPIHILCILHIAMFKTEKYIVRCCVNVCYYDVTIIMMNPLLS